MGRLAFPCEVVELTAADEAVDESAQVKILKSLWQPHPGQKAVMDHPARFRIIACGRRWGKSEMCAHIALERALADPGCTVWWVGPTYDDANDYGFDKMIPLLSPDVVAGSPKRSKPREIAFVNGSTVSFRSAQREDSLRGAGVDLLIIDESASVPDRAWKQELRPTLTDTQGDLVAIGTPKSGNWFYEWWNRGQSDEYPDVASWQAPSGQNPHIPPEEIEAAKAELPEPIYRQEYLAEFEAGGKRLRRDMLTFVDADEIEGNLEDFDWRVGVDLAVESNPTKARENDTDWLAVALVGIDRMNGQGYLVDVSKQRGLSLSESINFVASAIREVPNPTVVVEDNAAQSFWLQRAKEMGLRVYGATSTRPKAERILFMSVPFEQNDIVLVERDGQDWTPFIREWMDFDGSDSGTDDQLDAVELAIRGMQFAPSMNRMTSADPYGDRDGGDWA